MLYNPEWEKRAPLAEFAAWLEKQPASQEYDYTWPLFCAIGQWLTARGDENAQLNDAQVLNLLGKDGRRAVISHPRTFGALLERICNLP